jgi:Transcriptional regulators
MFIDDTDKDILRILRDNGRMSFTEIGNKLGMSRVAIKKRVVKLEESGIIRGYKAIIYREDSVKMLMEITTVDDNFEDLLEYLNRTGYVTELYIMTGQNRIHATAVAPDVSELKYLAKMVSKTFNDKIKTIGCHGVKEIVKDTLGGVEYDRAERGRNERNE